MRRLHATIACLTALGLATAADAHALLKSASPGAGATVPSASSVTLTFSESLEPKFSGAEVTGPAGRVSHGASISGNTMRVSVGSLGPGQYTVNWHALSVDTHKTQGSFSFTVGK